MNREYTDPHKESNPNTSAAIFSDLHRHPLTYPVVSRNVDNQSSGGGGCSVADPSRSQRDPKDSNIDGASIEVQRRPRGRPPGSKNKHKPPAIFTREPDPIASPYILEVVNGVDVLDAIAKFSRCRNVCLCVLSASGAVANVTIRHPSPNSSSSAVTFHGRFDILSLAATFVTPPTQSQIPIGALNVAISLSVAQGQIIGGIVAGPLIASGTVSIIAASFSSQSYHLLPVDDEAERKKTTTSSGGNEVQSPSAASGGNNAGAGDEDSGVVAMYRSNLQSDVIWAPTTRQLY